jgi:hypothetical protein
MAAIGLSRVEFLATYSQVIRIRPTRFLPWHGRMAPASLTKTMPIDRRTAAAIQHVATTTVCSPRRRMAAG